MSNESVFVIVLVAAAISVLAGIAMQFQRNTATEVSSEGIRLEPVLGGFVDAVHHCASEKDERYVSAVAQLRHNPNNTAHQIEAAYRSIGEEQIRARESLLLAATALAHPSVLSLLTQVATEPVRGMVQHGGGRAAEESMLRMMAVDGIEAVARSGDTNAADALLALTASPDRAVQALAVIALKYSDAHRTHYEKVRSMLSPDHLYLLDVVRANIHNVPQIADPRRHLRSEPTTVDTRPDLASGKRRNVEMPPQSARVPQARIGKE
jgi:hypothetical protein